MHLKDLVDGHHIGRHERLQLQLMIGHGAWPFERKASYVEI